MITLRNSERGWALISVLLVVTALSMLAAAAQSLTATSLRAEQRAWDRARLDTFLDAGVNAAVLGLVNNSQSDLWQVDGVPREFKFEGTTLHVAIQDERGRFDLNSVDGSVLKELLLSVGAAEKDVDHIVANILDWRSASGLDIPDAATAADYQAVGYNARHGAFQSVDELRLVLGVTEKLYERAAPALTVYSRLPAVEQSIAPQEVLTALNRMGSDVDENLKSRFGGGAASQQTQDAPKPVAVSLPLPGRTFSIIVDAEVAKRRLTRTAVILLTGDDANPYLVLAWH